MEITTSRTGEQLVLSLTGRMDGTGAQQVTTAIQQNLTDHDHALIFDLGGVDYLSSAGLRVFQESARKMKMRKGQIAVCRLQEFVRKLFVAGGFLRLLEEFPDTGSALAATAGHGGAAAGDVRISGNGWTLTASHLADTRGTLHVSGNLQALMTGAITADDVRESRVEPTTFSLGTGAPAPDKEAVLPLLGEMLQAGGAICWIPTDGNLTTDFFTPGDLASSGLNVYSLYRASFNGPCTDVLRVTPEKAGSLTLSMVYDAVFSYLRTSSPNYSGVCAVVIKGTVKGVCSSDLKTSILAAAAHQKEQAVPKNPAAHSMMELPTVGTVAESVSVADVKPRYEGDSLVAIGYGIDRQAAADSFIPETLAPLIFSNPRAPSDSPFLYTKGTIYHNLPWDGAAPFEEQVRSAIAGGGFSAMHNLLNITALQSAVVGIIPVQEIQIEP